MVTGPATFVVMLIVGLLLVAGAFILLIGRARGQQNRQIGPAKDTSACGACGRENVRSAQYCARCGKQLPRDETQSR